MLSWIAWLGCAPKTSPLPTLAEACHAEQGHPADVAWVIAPVGQPPCLAEPAVEISDRLEMRLDPPDLVMRPNEVGHVDLVVHNASDRQVGAKVARCTMRYVSVSVRDQAGTRVDLVERCGYGSGCGGPDQWVQLGPKAEMRLRLEVAAQVREQDDQCETGPPRPMMPGSYRVEVVVPRGPTLTAPLVVR
ncbi:MAG: hypothetical protein KTR31_38210 [Myxococcales bacterium]|nr:hypothetical protein [Myxococcales bacterium]